MYVYSIYIYILCLSEPASFRLRVLRLKAGKLGAEAGHIQVVGRVQKAPHQEPRETIADFVQQHHGTATPCRTATKDQPDQKCRDLPGILDGVGIKLWPFHGKNRKLHGVG